MSRRRPDGVLLSWELAFPPDGDGVVPFLIDWRDSPHPAASAVRGGRLAAFRGVHPEPALVTGKLDALGLALRVDPGERPGLTAELALPTGEVVVLR
nr:VOC family protein [Amycolatopsis rhizosphaerae]